MKFIESQSWRALQQRMRAKLEGHTKLDLICARRHKVSAAESREEVIQRFLVRDVERRKPQRHLGVLSAQQIVRADTEIKQMARRDTWRIAVVVLLAVGRDYQTQSAAIS